MTDRINILCDFNNCSYDQRNSGLLSLVDYFHCFHYPALGSEEKNNVSVYEGDPIYVSIPFRVETNPQNGVIPVLGKVTVSIVAIKSGQPDYVVESFPFDASTSCLYQGKQQVSFKNTRGYNSWSGDPYNSANLVYEPLYNQGTKAGYVLQYGFVARYDNWNKILTTLPGVNSCNAINNDLPNVNNAWSNLTGSGWSLVLRFYAEVTGYDNFITAFQGQTTVEVKAAGSSSDTGTNYFSQLFYFDNSGNPVNGIQSGTQTTVYAVFTPLGIPGIPSGYDDYYGLIWADTFGSTGPTNRRIASTEMDSEMNSPWSPVSSISLGSFGIPDSFRSDGYASIGVYNNSGIVIIASIYDDTILNWSVSTKGIYIIPRLGFKSTAIQTGDGRDIQTGDGRTILQG